MSISKHSIHRLAWQALTTVVAFGVSLTLIYIIIHILVPELRWGPAHFLFDLDNEVSIPTWFSTVQLFAVGILLFGAAWINKRPHEIKSITLVIAGAGFIFLSADEGAGIHEQVNHFAHTLRLDDLIFVQEGAFKTHGVWMIVYLVPAAVFLFLFRNAILRFAKYFSSEARLTLVGILVYVAGAIGMEAVSYLFLRGQDAPIVYKLEIATEELLEMVGVSILLFASIRLVGILLVNSEPESIDRKSVREVVSGSKS